MYKLIIFDLDGTLLDTLGDIANSTNHALSQYNLPTHSLEEYCGYIGNGLVKLIERSLPDNVRTDEVISMVKNEFVKHYFAHAEELTKPYAGIEELLTKLQNENYSLAIASNKTHPATASLAARFFPEIRFSDVFGQREGYPVKPNPSILNEIISNAGIDKSNVLYVGDSGVDVATAQNAGVDFTGVLWGFRPRKELEETGATVFVSNTDELYEIIRNKR